MQKDPVRSAPAVVVMGVAGCGKSAVGEALAAALGAIFVECD
ncbi:gluconokinase, partial [Mesorhizobium sp. M6A.T.Ca.TU.002.02.2.1]